MTHLVGLRLTHWQCFRGTHELDLSAGIYAIVAEDAADAGRSNWLGKSALLGAIRYALDGHKPKTHAALDDLISRGEDEMAVDVELSDGTFISRTKKRGRGTELRVIIQNESEIELAQDVAQHAIVSRLGLSAKDRESTCFAEQRKLASLVSAEGGADLASVVTEWLNLQALERAADRAGAALRSEAKLLRETEVKHTELMRRIEVASPAVWEARLAELCEQEKDHARRIAENKQRIAAHNDWLRLKERNDQTLRSRAAAQLEVDRLLAAYVALPAPEGDLEILEAAVQAAERVLVVFDQEHQQKRQLAAGKFNGTCPVNGARCPVAQQINTDLERNQQLALQAQERVAIGRGDVRRARDPLEEHQRLARHRDRAHVQLEQARHTLRSLGDAPLPELPPEPDVVDIIEGIGIGFEVQELRGLLARWRADVQASEELDAQLLDLRRSVAVRRAAFAVLGPEGAQRRVSERAVEAISKGANRDLQEAGIDLGVRVSWGRETQKPAEQCPQCGSAFPRSAAIKVCEGCLAPRGLKVSPELRVLLSRVSGAAEDLAGLAFRCAAFKWLAAKRDAACRFAVFDEPFGQLDQTNKRSLAAHVQRMLAGTFDQAFVVAHDRAVLDAFPRRILITGNGDWSSAKIPE